MESSKCESADDMDAEQLATAHCTRAQQSGGGSAPAAAKADQLAVECQQKKRHTVEETTEKRAVWLQSYIPFCARCSHQASANVAVSSLCNCSTCLRKVRTLIYIVLYIHSKILNRTRSLALLCSLMLAARQFHMAFMDEQQ